MNLRFASLIALGIAMVGAIFMVFEDYLFSKNPVTIIIQFFSAALMIWARITFGRRSFHAAANASKGLLITTGPYHWLRHPIYASLIYFFSASIISYPVIESIVTVIIICIALLVRMFIEEKFLLATYSEYAEYSKTTKRILPFVY
ncbi:MAG: hypothetical protein M3139_10825 [Bacteroidota bacterium]|nr:hypothetical protein [Bacteroidota bacterium]